MHVIISMRDGTFSSLAMSKVVLREEAFQ